MEMSTIMRHDHGAGLQATRDNELHVVLPVIGLNENGRNAVIQRDARFFPLKDKTCLINTKLKSNGADVRSFSKPGKIARQADGAVLATYGETVVLATVVSAKEPKPGQDFFPLTVNYQEKTYAAGKIPGGYFKREGRPSENETLVSRLIDRPIRPLFADGYKNDTQVVITVIQHDLENNPDIVSMIGASAALTLSGVPFMGPIGGARVGYIGGEYKLNPTIDEMVESSLDLVVAGTGDAVLMVESEAKELAEDVMLGAVMFGHKGFQPVSRRDHQARRGCCQGTTRFRYR